MIHRFIKFFIFESHGAPGWNSSHLGSRFFAFLYNNNIDEALRHINMMVPAGYQVKVTPGARLQRG